MPDNERPDDIDCCGINQEPARPREVGERSLASLEPVGDGIFRMSISHGGHVTDIYEGSLIFIIREALRLGRALQLPLSAHPAGDEVERAAKAMHARTGLRWEDARQPTRQVYLDDARAALTAVRPHPAPGEVERVAYLEAVEAAARDLITSGLVNHGPGRGLVVVEKADKSDPHYRLCELLERPDASLSTPAVVEGDKALAEKLEMLNSVQAPYASAQVVELAHQAAARIRGLSAEVERVKDEADDLVAAIVRWRDACGKAEAEVEKLRAALEKIELLSTNHGAWFEKDPWAWGQMMGSAARDSLQPKQGGGE